MHINISTSTAYFRWRPAAWLRVSGADAAAFLQGQFTNDLRPLESAGVAAVYGLWLTVKGKVLADSFVVRGDKGGYWVGSYASPAAVIREHHTMEHFGRAFEGAIEDALALPALARPERPASLSRRGRMGLAEPHWERVRRLLRRRIPHGSAGEEWPQYRCGAPALVDRIERRMVNLEATARGACAQ